MTASPLMFAMLFAPVAVELVLGLAPLFGAWSVDLLVPPP